MTRSRKKTPIFNITSAESNRTSKKFCNRLFRTIAKRNLKKGRDLPMKQDEVMTEWEFEGDGKRYIKDVPQGYMRK